MARLRLLAAVLFFATSALAAPNITSITPSEGSESGGTEVIIRGTGFSTTCTGCTPEVKPPDVLFGGVLAPTIGFIDATELRVRTPEHAPGLVPVTVRQQDGEHTVPNGFTFTEDRYKISPRTGPVSGGTVVTITGEFGSWPYGVIFGGTHAPAWRLDEHTLVAVTPPAPGPGPVPVVIFEYDIGIDTGQTFIYTQSAADTQERILLPLFVPPINGANGSRFITELRAINRSAFEEARIYGIERPCLTVCPPVVFDPERDAMVMPPRSEIGPADVVYDGSPGRFLWVSKDDVDQLWLNLRVYDESRSNQNFGTEMPVVRDRELFRNQPILFSGVPSETRFRNTLRIYATGPMTVNVQISAALISPIIREVTLRPGLNRFDPAYAQIGDMPVGVGPLRITITPPEPGSPGFHTPYWAFVSVTNNDTQLITTIRP